MSHTLKLITGGDQLLNASKDVLNRVAAVNIYMHQVFISTLNHAALHGDFRPLNNLYSNADKNKKSMMKFHVQRFQKENPEAAAFSMKDDLFTLKDYKENSERNAARQQFIALVPALLNPDGVQFKFFFERDVIVEAAVLDNTTFIKRLATLVTKAEKEGSKVDQAIVARAKQVLETARHAVH